MSRPNLFVCLENIRSAYNVGSIFRTSDSAGISKLFLTGYTPYPPHPKLDKTALGSLNSVPWEHVADITELLHHLKELKIQLVAFETIASAKSLYDFRVKADTCMIFGNEVTGLSQPVLDLANATLKIPQFGTKESLNVATAAGVAIYEFRRQTL